MHTALAFVYVTLLSVVALLSVWLATVDYRHSQVLQKQTAPTWPLEFAVYWLDYYLGPRLAKYLRVGQLLFLIPMAILEASEAIFRDRQPQGMILIYFAGIVALVVRAYVPKICRVDDNGITFERLYRWEAIHRWKISRERLVMVAECPGPQPIVAHIEIPLNGLAPAFRTALEEQLATHVTGAAVASLANA
jgi:hypothetical protein